MSRLSIHSTEQSLAATSKSPIAIRVCKRDGRVSSIIIICYLFFFCPPESARRLGIRPRNEYQNESDKQSSDYQKRD